MSPIPLKKSRKSLGSFRDSSQRDMESPLTARKSLRSYKEDASAVLYNEETGSTL